MHMIITDAWLAKTRPIHLSGTKLVLAGLLLSLALMVVAAGLYHWVFLKGAREGWPVVGGLVKLVVKDEFEQRDRFMRENLDAMARKVGEMQAKIVQLESITERVSGLAGIPVPDAVKTNAAKEGGSGGALIGGRNLSLQELQATLADLEALTSQKVDLLTVVESRLFDQKIRKMMVPTAQPVPGSVLGSPFGFRTDPINGRTALHTGLDFQSDTGTPILAAAGGVVVTQEYHAAYGNMIEIDHGNDLITRGQKIAAVGTTGRSTGPHLHFEVLVQGLPQDPQKFLTAGEKVPEVVAVVKSKSKKPLPAATSIPVIQSTEEPKNKTEN
jgi:murein DD-endopeptidase MepM/ murein hydrolase activator NlpD